VHEESYGTYVVVESAPGRRLGGTLIQYDTVHEVCRLRVKFPYFVFLPAMAVATRFPLLK
jgi:hypothetical protein